MKILRGFNSDTAIAQVMLTLTNSLTKIAIDYRFHHNNDGGSRYALMVSCTAAVQTDYFYNIIIDP